LTKAAGRIGRTHRQTDRSRARVVTRARRVRAATRESRARLLEHFLIVVVLAILAVRATINESPHAESADPFQFLTNAAFSTLLSAALLVWAVAAWFTSRRRHCDHCRSVGAGMHAESQRPNAIRPETRPTAEPANVRDIGSGIGPGLAVFLVAVVISCIVASDKRSAATDALGLAVPMIAAMMLVRLLHTAGRIRMVLAMIAAAGLVNALQSAQQAFASNRMVIEQYEKDPRSMLEPLGIESGSFQAMLYEHRLYGKDVRGFFMTGNSAGSYFLLAAAALLALWLARPQTPNTAARAWCHAAIIFCLVRILAGLVLVHSKGATLAAGMAAGLFMAGWRLGSWLRRHRTTVAVGGLLLVVGVSAALVAYGRGHGTLPGGRSMRIRWEYWTATARMIRDHPLGVGGGNFRHYYPAYKAPEALETVQDPHNFVLSLVAQYGPLGLFGVLLAVVLPAWRATGRHRDRYGAVTSAPGTDRTHTPGPSAPADITTNAQLVMLALAAALVFAVRPFFLAGQATRQAEMPALSVLYLYAVPAVVLAGGAMLAVLPLTWGAVSMVGALVVCEGIESVLFDTSEVGPIAPVLWIAVLYGLPLAILLLGMWRSGRAARSSQTGMAHSPDTAVDADTPPPLPPSMASKTGGTATTTQGQPAAEVCAPPPFNPLACRALWIGLAAVLIAALVDFAWFEPGIWTAFWIMLACAVAAGNLTPNRVTGIEPVAPAQAVSKPHPVPPEPRDRIATLASGLAAVPIGVVLIVGVILPVWSGYLQQQARRSPEGPTLLMRAAAIDPLDPLPAHDAAKLCLAHYRWTGDTSMLNQAIDALQQAIRRNPAGFKSPALLAEAYRLRGQVETEAGTGADVSIWLEKAIEQAQRAVGRYPGSARLHMNLAELAEAVGRPALARQHYAQAVAIEQSFQAHFRLMYPGRPVVSRLGTARFEKARRKLEQLQDRLPEGQPRSSDGHTSDG